MIETTLGIASSVAFAAAVGMIFFLIYPYRLPASFPGGERGESRRDAIARWPALGAVLPLIRSLALQIGTVGGSARTEKIEEKLELAGHPFGFDAAEMKAIAVLSSSLCTAFGALASHAVFGAAIPGVVVGAVFGAAAPFIKLDDAIRGRAHAIGRGLPRAIDLIALAMEGGGDLLSAMGHVVARLAPRDPLRFELQHVARKLGLGHSRGAAFSQLAKRVPTAVVKQFVASVLQGEKQGTPLGEVLAVQARVMRLRRSEAAEQAAARAAVLIIGPLMLIFACVFIVLLGPFAIGAIRGQLF
jgi:tight adherence protein C